ncbi:hypothetical protein KXS15_09535 [Sinorhizobium meliloti]|uniref:hypothetical protein n=1 Tax=Rhizobium meliloti TaxID=382 RepID=UPI003F1784BC
MPIRHRKNKKRSTDGLNEWESVFSTGYDLLWELQMSGVDVDEYGQPSADETEAAWRRLGEAYMELPRHPDLPPPWALEQFGAPWIKGRRRRQSLC